MRKTLICCASAFALVGMASTASAYRIFDTYSPSGNGSPIAKGECNDGTNFTVKYYPNNGTKYAIYSLWGDSAEEVISRFCGNKGG